MNPKMIDCHVYIPMRSGFFKDNKGHAFCKTYHCSNSDNCQMYSQGKCVMKNLQLFGNESCPYGETQNIQGPTIRSNKLSDFHKDINEKFPHETRDLLKSTEETIYSCGEYYYLPMLDSDYFDNDDSLRKLFIGKFIKKEDLLNKDVLLKIINTVPYSMWGEQIKKYQKIKVPIFINSIKRNHPEIKKILVDCGCLVEEEVLSNIGRKALLSTLNKDIEVTINKDKFYWDGTKLKALSKLRVVCFIPGEWEVFLTPKYDQVVEIENENQVNDSTEYLT